MLPDRVSNPGPLTYESGVLPIALRGPAVKPMTFRFIHISVFTIFHIDHRCGGVGPELWLSVTG